MKPVLFTSDRPLERAENIHAVFSAFHGPKEFVQTYPRTTDQRLRSTAYSLRVCDEFIGSSPGKAVMIGHGIPGGKTYGLDQPYAYHRRENAQYLTYVVTSSKEMVPLVAKQSGISEDRVLALGMPRTDAYFGVSKGDGGTFLSKKRAYLFAPTFRTKMDPPLPVLNWHWLDDQLTDSEVLVVKPHMITGHLLTGQFKHIVEASANVPSTPYLIDCDVLITDYSSILFDAHILGKPVVLLEKHLGYLQSRGMYMEYPSGYASRYCRNEKELLATIRNADKPGKEDRICLKRTAAACDGHSSERVCELIRSMI